MLEEVLKVSKDEDLKERRSETFEIYKVNIKGLSSEESFLLVVAKYFSELREGVSSLSQVKMLFNFQSILLESVTSRISR